jgi:hypothetical protein
VDRSGHFKQQIGETVSIASGNSPKHKDTLRLVEFDLYRPEEAERKIIGCDQDIGSPLWIPISHTVEIDQPPTSPQN